jgi:hypothetical protein
MSRSIIFECQDKGIDFFECQDKVIEHFNVKILLSWLDEDHHFFKKIENGKKMVN